jgi:hypothetical protein
MLIVWILVGSVGAISTVVELWSTDPVLSLLLAPVGGSILIFIGSGGLYLWSERRLKGGVPRPQGSTGGVP